jgi:hypothetical protein
MQGMWQSNCTTRVKSESSASPRLVVKKETFRAQHPMRTEPETNQVVKLARDE